MGDAILQSVIEQSLADVHESCALDEVVLYVCWLEMSSV